MLLLNQATTPEDIRNEALRDVLDVLDEMIDPSDHFAVTQALENAMEKIGEMITD